MTKERPPEDLIYRAMWQLTRDVMLFLAGLIGVFYELVHGPVNSSLLVVFSAMLGFPIALPHGKK